MNPKCGHCRLLGETGQCLGQRNSRICLRADPKSDLHLPGIIEKIVSFGVAVVEHVAAGMLLATEKQKAERLAICNQCEHFKDGGCKLCGCSMDIKAEWADRSCPIGKWLPIKATQGPTDRHQSDDSGQ